MKTTYSIYCLNKDQKQTLLNILLAETAPPSCQLPIYGNSNRARADPEDRMKETGIYRDRWERTPLTKAA